MDQQDYDQIKDLPIVFGMEIQFLGIEGPHIFTCQTQSEGQFIRSSGNNMGPTIAAGSPIKFLMEQTTLGPINIQWVSWPDGFYAATGPQWRHILQAPVTEGTQIWTRPSGHTTHRLLATMPIPDSQSLLRFQDPITSEVVGISFHSYQTIGVATMDIPNITAVRFPSLMHLTENQLATISGYDQISHLPVPLGGRAKMRQSPHIYVVEGVGSNGWQFRRECDPNEYWGPPFLPGIQLRDTPVARFELEWASWNPNHYISNQTPEIITGQGTNIMHMTTEQWEAIKATPVPLGGRACIDGEIYVAREFDTGRYQFRRENDPATYWGPGFAPGTTLERALRGPQYLEWVDWMPRAANGGPYPVASQLDRSFEIGMRFTIPNYEGETYILSQVSVGNFLLIGLKTGNRLWDTFTRLGPGDTVARVLGKFHIDPEDVTAIHWPPFDNEAPAPQPAQPFEPPARGSSGEAGSGGYQTDPPFPQGDGPVAFYLHTGQGASPDQINGDIQALRQLGFRTFNSTMEAHKKRAEQDGPRYWKKALDNSNAVFFRVRGGDSSEYPEILNQAKERGMQIFEILGTGKE